MAESKKEVKKEVKITSALPSESVKVIAESVSFGGLPDEAAIALASDTSYRLKQMVQVSKKISIDFELLHLFSILLLYHLHDLLKIFFADIYSTVNFTNI